jgi:hypothetical protein
MSDIDDHLEKARRDANKEMYGTEDGHTFDPGEHGKKKCTVCGEKRSKHK